LAAARALSSDRLAMPRSSALLARPKEGSSRSLILATPRMPQRTFRVAMFRASMIKRLKVFHATWPECADRVTLVRISSAHPNGVAAGRIDTTKMYPHRIRLRGPWQCEPLSQDPEAPSAPRRISVPCRLADCGLAGFSGRVRFTRKFGYPGRIDAHERVWLTFAGVEGSATIHLNRRLLGESLAGALEFDVTPILGPRNQLEVLLDAADDRAGLVGEVALEVRCTAYLQGVTLQRDPVRGLILNGQVAGTCDGPLELYVLQGRRTVHYQPASAGQTFAIQLSEGAASGQTFRVELVNVAAVWYVVELAT
jgi:hypothetical protein